MVSRHRVFASSSFGKTDILILIIASHPRTLVKSRSSRHFVILVCHASFQSRHSTRQASFPHRLFVVISVPIPPQLLRHSSVTVPSRFSSAFFPEFTHGSSTSRAPMTRIIIFGSTPPVNPIVIHPKASVMACKKKRKKCSYGLIIINPFHSIIDSIGIIHLFYGKIPLYLSYPSLRSLFIVSAIQDNHHQSSSIRLSPINHA